MARDMPHNTKILQEQIRRQFGSAGTSRFLRALPSLQVEHKIPERFTNLLTELDHAESSRRNDSRRGARG